MRWTDRVYGEVSIEDPAILDLICSATYSRLKGVRQSGPSAMAFPFKNVTRYEHCLGVYHLLGRLGAPKREQVAGLLHDISHTAFSHAVDFVFSSEEQAHHEQLKPLLLERDDIVKALARMGYTPSEFYDDSVYPLLEQPLPALCADRLDYFLRDGLACGLVSYDFVRRILASIAVVDGKLVLTDVAVAREAARLFANLNRQLWASPIEAFIYNEFADALREGMTLGVLAADDLLTEDDLVLAKLESADSPLIARKLGNIRNCGPESAAGYVPRIIPKERWLDPAVRVQGRVERLSALDGDATQGEKSAG
jgi:hypothetical protein